MRIIVGGANSISRSIVGYLSHGNNDIVVIDDDEQALDSIAQEWDVLPILGPVSHPDLLKKAGFKSEAILKDEVIDSEGDYQDIVRFSLMRL